MKNRLRRIMSMALAILMILTCVPSNTVAEIVSGSQTDTSGAFSLRTIAPYTPTLHVSFVVDGATVAQQYVVNGGTLNRPATPTKEDHKFVGWYNGEDQPSFGTPLEVTGDSSVTYTAAFEPIYYVFFHDVYVESQGYRVIATLEGVNGEELEFTSVPNPTLTGDQAFLGWKLDGTVVDNVTINGADIHLYPDVQEGHWITYHSGEGATYIAPEFKKPNEVTSAPAQPSRPGYTFEHWSATDGGEEYTFGKTLDKSIDLYSVWTANTNTKYLVIHLIENVDDDNYSYKESEEKSGTTGVLTQAHAKSYDGFTAEEITQETIAGDGSTIVEVKYKRNVYTIYFYPTSGSSSNETLTCTKEEHEHSWRCYDWRGNLTCTREEHTHTDACYTTTTSEPLYKITAKYGAYIGDQWPTHNGSTNWSTVKNGGAPWQAGINTMPLNGDTFYVPNVSGNNTHTASYYVEVLDGESGETVSDAVYKLHHQDSIKGSGFTVSDEDFYDILGFTKNTSISTKNGSSYNGAKFYYTRNDYTIKFINGGKEIDTVTKQYEANLTDVSMPTPSRPEGVPEGYTFVGWFDNEAGAGDPYAFADDAKMPAKNITLYAKWEAPVYDATVYLTMEGNGGSKVLEIPYGTSIIESDLPSIEIPDGYEMHGWSTTPNSYTPFNFNTKLTGNISLYPYYTKAGAFTVTYVVDEAAGGNAPVDNETYADGSYAEIKTPAALRYKAEDGTNMVFVYWTGSDGNNYTPRTKAKITDNLILTAVYVEEEEKVSLTYHSNYPSETGLTNTTSGSDKYYVNQKFAVSGNMFTAPSGYEFTGWNTSTSGGANENYAPGKEISLTDGSNNDLYAQWKKSTFKVTYEYTGAVPSGAPALPAEADVEYQADYTVAAVPSLPGYTFEGWKKDGEKVTSFSMPASNVTLSGSWSIRTDLSYTVNYLEKDTNAVLAEAKTVNGQTYKASVTEEAIEISGYDKVAPTTAMITIEVENNVINFYYEKADFTVSYAYDSNYTVPADAPSVPASVSVTYKDTYNVEEELELAGYTFSGWYYDGQIVSSFEMPATNVTLTGYFVANDATEYTVEFYYQNNDGITYPESATSSDVRYGKTDTTASVKDTDKADKEGGKYVLDTAAANVMEGNIAGNGSLVLKLYFKLNTSTYTIHHYLHNTEVKVADDQVGTAKIDDTITASASSKLYSEYAAAEVSSYDPAKSITIKVAADDNVITVYYKVALRITADSDSKTYDAKPLTDSGFTAEGLVNGDTKEKLNIVMTAESTITNVGSIANVIDEGKATIPGYYVPEYVNGTLTITKATVTVTADDKTKVYGEADPELTATVTGLKNGDTESVITYTLSRAEGENIGTYTITPSGAAEQGNYNVEYKTGTLVITTVTDKVTVTITENAAEYTYDGTEKTVEGYKSMVSDNTLYDVKTSVKETATDAWTAKGTEQGTYPVGIVAADFENTNKNFTNVEFVIVDGALKINPVTDKVTVTITENAAEYTYDGIEKTVEGYKSMVSSNTLYDVKTSVKETATDAWTAKGTEQGTYPVGIVAADFENTNPNFKNVEFVIVDGALKINPVTDKVTVTITENKAEYTYD